MINLFTRTGAIIGRMYLGLSTKARIIIVVFLLLFAASMGYGAYRVNDYFENDPGACSVCHVHDAANKAWVSSEHSGVNCHECHYATKADQMRQLYSFVVLGRNKVSPRHGEVLVPWKLCFGCHWERNGKYPAASDISRSRFHAKHVFTEQIECTKCHGYRTHKFSLEERYCVSCHRDKEVKEHGQEGESCGPAETLPCLNCHTDRTRDLMPGRKKCLYCHGGEAVRKELIADGTIDVKHFAPPPGIIRKASKVETPPDAPMQFVCHDCHNPHLPGKVKPASGECLSRCHSTVRSAGKHELHLALQLKCLDCHKAHLWKVTEAQAKKDCVKCHEYKDPKAFNLL